MADFSLSAPPDTAVRARREALVGHAVSLLPAFVAAVAVGGLAAGRGGYFPTTWGWAAVPLCWLAAVAICLRRVTAFGPLERALVSLLVLFVGWIALSAAWSAQPSQTVLEVERSLVYPAGVLAVLLVARRTAAASVLGGVLCGIVPVCAYALATRLFPERLGRFDSIAGYRLSRPVTYWNSLGLLAAIGLVLALAFALRGRRAAIRALAAAALPVLLPTLYFTFSRGAWLALALGVVAAVALDPRRLQLASGLILLVPAAIATWLGSQSQALTRLGTTLAKATHDGHRLALLVLLLALVSAGVALAFAWAERRVRAGAGARRAYGSVLLLALAAALVALSIHYGGPVESVRRAYDSFTSPPVRVTSGSLNKRLFSFSSNGRVDLWRIAVDDFEAHPLLGSGSGTYERVYLRDRPTADKVRDAHSLYVETLGELGVLGLALLALALLVPVVGAIRARRHPLVPVAFGAYVAFLLHAGVDWDWEVTGVTLAGLLCGAAFVLAARDSREPVRLAVATRVALLALTAAVCAFSFVGLLGNTATASSHQAIVDGRWAAAASEAKRAIRWAPWSPRGRQYLGEAQFALGRHAAGLENVRDAIRQDPGDWDLWWTLALLTDGSTRRQATLTALRLNPRSPELAEWIAGVGLKLPKRAVARATS